MLTFFEAAKHDCVFKAKVLFSFLVWINNSVTVGASFVLLIISSNSVDISRFFVGYKHQYFYKNLSYYENIQ